LQTDRKDHAAKTGLFVDRMNVRQNHSNQGRHQIHYNRPGTGSYSAELQMPYY
jgi:hypothetical protein